jgi:carbamoyl-phosphate synthase small subunit
MQPNRQAVLALADGTVFLGRGFGADGDSEGEVVFNTSMTGYPELLTDPSYRRQIVCLTYPEIGNYGVARRDQESEGLQVSGLVVRALSPRVSNWRSELDLDMWLKEAGVPGIVGIDTRALVRHIRDRGAMMGIVRVAAPGVSVSDEDCLALVAKAKSLPGMEGCALTDEVSIKVPTPFTEGVLDDDGQPLPPLAPAHPARGRDRPRHEALHRPAARTPRLPGDGGPRPDDGREDPQHEPRRALPQQRPRRPRHPHLRR